MPFIVIRSGNTTVEFYLVMDRDVTPGDIANVSSTLVNLRRSKISVRLSKYNILREPTVGTSQGEYHQPQRMIWKDERRTFTNEKLMHLIPIILFNCFPVLVVHSWYSICIRLFPMLFIHLIVMSLCRACPVCAVSTILLLPHCFWVHLQVSTCTHSHISSLKSVKMQRNLLNHNATDYFHRI